MHRKGFLSEIVTETCCNCDWWTSEESFEHTVIPESCPEACRCALKLGMCIITILGCRTLLLSTKASHIQQSNPKWA